MIRVLQNRTYAALFSAQVVALLGTGLLTVALGLLAFDLAGSAAGAVLGTAYAIKMVAYVGLAPVAAAVLERFDRKAVLILADLVRAGVALCLPFIDAVWQIYVLIFLLQAASATFTPAFQAVIPDILPEEADYTRALSLSRLAFELENVISPVVAGLLLAVISYHWLFVGTVVGFGASALLVWRSNVPPAVPTGRDFGDRLTRGVRLYLATPRLRGLLALTLTAASAGAFVLVNTVVLVRGGFGGSEADLAMAMAAFGAGAMVVALGLPRLLDHVADRVVMMQAAGLLAGVSVAVGFALVSQAAITWTVFLVIWAVLGALESAILTPSGRLVKRSAEDADRPALFTAQFALSHVCWLITYPLAGWLGQAFGLGVAMLVLAWLAIGGLIMASWLWKT